MDNDDDLEGLTVEEIRSKFSFVVVGDDGVRRKVGTPLDRATSGRPRFAAIASAAATGGERWAPVAHEDAALNRGLLVALGYEPSRHALALCREDQAVHVLGLPGGNICEAVPIEDLFEDDRIVSYCLRHGIVSVADLIADTAVKSGSAFDNTAGNGSGDAD